MLMSLPVQDYPRIQEDLDLIAQRGILPGSNGYTTRQLAAELSMRGWRWKTDSERAEATKAFVPSGTVSHTVISEGPSVVENFVTILASAIRFDDDRGLAPARAFQPDIELLAPDGQVVATVEVRNREPLLRDFAANWRRNLLTHGMASTEVPFLLLVSQEEGHLWDQRQSLLPNSPPTLSFSMQPVTRFYAPWLSPGERLGGAQLQLLVARWLDDLAGTTKVAPGSFAATFKDTDFVGMIRDATFRSETER